MTLKNDEQKLIVESENGKKIIFTYENREKLVTDLKDYFPNLFPHIKPLFAEMLTKLTQ